MKTKILLINLFFGMFLSASQKPNLIVILSDDQGWGDLSMNGNKDISTPNIDSIADNGARFDNFYVCPVCSPTRAEFLTGRYHSRSSVYSTSAGGERMDLDEITIADTFKKAGYATGAFGKWHSGMQFPYHPNARGFDEFYGFCSGHWGNYFDPVLDHNNRIVKGKGFLPNDCTEQAMKFIEKNKNKPFFAYIPYCTPHSPMQVPDKYWDKFKNKKLSMNHKDRKTHTRAALAMCENIDWNVGRILEKLEELKLRNNTIILYFSDNGPNGKRWNGGMKGRKGSADEGGIRSPLVMQWPGKIKANKTITRISGAIDLLPTLADMCGISVLKGKKLDGISIKKTILTEQSGWPNRYIFTQWKESKSSLRNQRYRIDHKGGLYDIERDRSQLKNVRDEYPEIYNTMLREMKRIKTDVDIDSIKTPDSDNRPFYLTHPDAVFTQLPARDALFTGKIKRSNKWPNSSFLENWISRDDYIYWNGEVAAAGKYEVVIYYTVSKKDRGSTIQLSFGNSKLATKITKAHNPPLFGAENDRHPRVESYVKDFMALNMGVMTLKKGTGKLILKALKMPGTSVIDFRLLTLKRVW